MNIGTWNGWTEPAREPDPRADAAACPTCGFSPKLTRPQQHGMRFFVLSCCTYETTPRLTLEVAIREWNDAADYLPSTPEDMQ